jgi:hypothetical protein
MTEEEFNKIKIGDYVIYSGRGSEKWFGELCKVDGKGSNGLNVTSRHGDGFDYIKNFSTLKQIIEE